MKRTEIINVRVTKELNDAFEKKQVRNRKGAVLRALIRMYVDGKVTIPKEVLTD